MTEKITSLSNSQIKEAVKLSQKKYREKEKLFLIEGEKAVLSAFQNGYKIQKIFLPKGKIEKFSFLSDNLIEITEEIMKKISTTDSIPEVVAIAEMKYFDVNSFKKMKKILLLENIKDAGNLGTILRSACAFGIEGVIFSGDTVDVFNTKVIRSSVGTVFMLPFVKIEVSELKNIFKEHQIISTTLHEKNTFTPETIDLSKKHIIAFGSEASGITKELTNISDKFLKIEHDFKVESLNLSVAASIVLYETGKK